MRLSPRTPTPHREAETALLSPAQLSGSNAARRVEARCLRRAGQDTGASKASGPGRKDRPDAEGRAEQEETKAWLMSEPLAGRDRTSPGQVGAGRPQPREGAACTLGAEECTSPGPNIRHTAGGALHRCHPLCRGF